MRREPLAVSTVLCRSLALRRRPRPRRGIGGGSKLSRIENTVVDRGFMLLRPFCLLCLDDQKVPQRSSKKSGEAETIGVYGHLQRGCGPCAAAGDTSTTSLIGRC